MRMHHELLHDMLQEEEARALVIKINPDGSDEEGEEEYAYAGEFDDDFENL
jgi:hypothetical protein